MGDWKEILSGDEEQISAEELLKYLDEELSDEEKRAIEKKINNNPFEVDAVDGLSQIQDKESLEKHVSQLNLKLQQFTTKRPRKAKQKIKIFEWIILTLVILLFICVISFIIISLQNKPHFSYTNPFSVNAVFNDPF
ncbi:MAG TPA: hypothetical protein VF540_12355 [Segetibacter sp.]